MTFLGLIILIIFIFILLPFLCFLEGWISGWLIKITIGKLIVSGLALMGFTLSLDHLPLFFGTLAVIASFFKTYHYPKNFKED